MAKRETQKKKRPAAPRQTARRVLAQPAGEADEQQRIERGAVVVTGICGRLGRRLARQLHRERRVVGLDRREFHGKPKDIEHYAIDKRRKKARELFRAPDIGALVHLGVMHDPRASDARATTLRRGAWSL